MKLNTITRFSANENENSPSLVFLHGNSMKAEFFKNLMDCNELTNYNSIAIDLPGHGSSPKLENYSIPTLLHALENEIKGFNSVIMVGHSLGGHLAVQLFSRIGDLCKGIS